MTDSLDLNRLGEALERGAARDLRRLAVEPLEDAEPLAGGSLDPAAPHALEQDVAGDPEEPRTRGAAGLVAEARAHGPRLRERLGRQVERGVARP